MSVSKAYLRRLYRVVKDRERLADIRKFLMKYDEEINTNNLVITADGEMYYEGSIGKVTFYRKWGKYHRKRKSSLTGKRFRKDKAFKGSRESAERFAAGNRLASTLYATVDAEKKAYSLFCFLKKRAIALLKEGKSEDEAWEVLVDYLRSFEVVEQKEKHKEKVEPPVQLQLAVCSERNHIAIHSLNNLDSHIDLMITTVLHKPVHRRNLFSILKE